jgi:uncharacterized protein (DUF302 family)
MLKIKLIILSVFFISSFAFASDGMISIKSKHSVKKTSKRLVKALNEKGMTVFDTIDHKKGAKKVGKKLRPTTLVIFGNPKIGTPLMHCSQSIALDLPQKALIWKDKNGQVWYTYNDPQYLAKRHNINGCDKVLAKVSKALANFANKATN